MTCTCSRTLQVAVMNGLSANIHLMFVPFYRPTPERSCALETRCPFLPACSVSPNFSRASCVSICLCSYINLLAHAIKLHFSSGRYKIIMEAKAFPSDRYIVESQVKFHGYEPSEAIVVISPRAGES